MSYLVLARKYRPKNFDEVVGQEHVTGALKSAIAANKVAHAFLFSGPRGVGKTTCARILAKEINKSSPQSSGLLEFEGGNMDIIEIDGASNNSVDDARIIRESAMFMSMGGGYKFYIIDEVHMLSTAAFNALLKTLEEPPEHVKFIFATTDPEKVPTTIRSRCQHFHFKRLPLDVIKNQLKTIAQTEKLSVEEEALFAIARAAQGGMRDALGILDQLAAGGEKVTLAAANGLLGLIDVKYIFDLANAIVAKDGASAMNYVESIVNAGKDERRLLRDMVEHFRHLMLMKIDPEKLQSLVDYPVFYRKQLLEQASQLSLENILKVMDILILSKDTERLTNAPRLALELAIAQTIIVLLPAQAPATPLSPVKPVAATLPLKPAPIATVAPKPVKPTAPVGQPAPATPSTQHTTPTATAVSTEILALAHVKRVWSEMTAAVQAQKTYLGTYLLEGAPVAVNGQTLTVAFPMEFLYHKECLEEPAAIKLISEIFSNILGQSVMLSFALMDSIPQEKSAQLQHALDAFEGEVVNEWHNE